MNVNCPHCNTLLEASDNVNNEVVQCPVCNKEFIIQGTVNTHRKIRVTQNNMHANPHGVMPQKNVPNYFGWSIFVLLFCLTPFFYLFVCGLFNLIILILCILAGIVPITLSHKVNKKLSQGDNLGAYSISKRVKTWIFISFFLGVFLLILCSMMITGANKLQEYERRSHGYEYYHR
jgi:Zn-finger nucleic acid-binding protein